MDVKLEPTWKAKLKSEFTKPYWSPLTEFVRAEYKAKTIYPKPKQVFRAFDECPFNEVKVVILGQDPYHGTGQANGLCFAVSGNTAIPPSLQNIFKEIESDIGHPIERGGDLERWAKQGVLLLNATLTVRANTAGSHQGKGWEEFTTAAIKKLSDEREHLVFLLWGRYAQVKGQVIDSKKHLVLQSAHPSPLSAYSGFFGNKHFSKTNEYLRKYGKKGIEW